MNKKLITSRIRLKRSLSDHVFKQTLNYDIDIERLSTGNAPGIDSISILPTFDYLHCTQENKAFLTAKAIQRKLHPNTQNLLYPWTSTDLFIGRDHKQDLPVNLII